MSLNDNKPIIYKGNSEVKQINPIKILKNGYHNFIPTVWIIMWITCRLTVNMLLITLKNPLFTLFLQFISLIFHDEHKLISG